MTYRLIAIALVGLAASCRQNPQTSRTAAGANHKQPNEVVAEVDGTKVTSAELEDRTRARLTRLRQEEYEIRKEALDNLVGERLIDAEAKRRGLSREALIKTEVDDKAQKPTPADIDRVYEQYKARLGGRTRAQAGPEIEESLRRQAAAEQNSTFVQSLRSRAKIAILLAPPRTEVSVPASAPSLGPATAAVTIIGFSDFQCPYCHQAQVTMDKLVATYGTRIRVIHRDFPLDGHNEATPAARAARCAGEQGRFWEYHRGLMTEPGDLGAADLAARGKRAGLDEKAFGACLASERHQAEVKQDVQDGVRAGVSGTPTYFINGRMITGARPFEAFSEIIEAELAR